MRQKPNKKHLLLYLGGHFTLLAAALIFLFLDSRDVFDVLGECPWLMFGLYCPTCGMTRASRALLHLDLATALRRNAMIFPTLALLAYYEVVLLRMIFWRKDARTAGARYWPLVVYGLVFLAFFLARNLLLLAGFDPTGDLLAWR